MARQKFEFYCSNCVRYFDFNLNTALNGNYRIHCPECGHTHYRKVEGGEITDIRFPENDINILIEDIWPMKSSCRDYRNETPEENEDTGKSFISRLWKEKFSVA